MLQQASVPRDRVFSGLCILTPVCPHECGRGTTWRLSVSRSVSDFAANRILRPKSSSRSRRTLPVPRCVLRAASLSLSLSRVSRPPFVCLWQALPMLPMMRARPLCTPINLYSSRYDPLSVCLSVCLSVSLSLCLSVSLSLCLSVCPAVCRSFFLSLSYSRYGRASRFFSAIPSVMRAAVVH
eukprot:COSAG03_NODE_52_length_16230_cov_22.987168_25_plen_182_part_00